MGSKPDPYYMEKALIEIKAIINYTNGYSYDEFMKDYKTIDATLFRLQQMIEHIKNLSADFKNNHSYIPWSDIVGFRNRIVHDYGKTDYTTVYEVVTKSIYQIKELFEMSLQVA
ncbi:MAG: DUF86 domain-containing protein [Bacilli bacterium]|nr:DUF86 domain-containing protein [Bacilli bacterium]